MFKLPKSLKSFVSNNFGIDKRNQYGYTPLMWEAMGGWIKLDGGLGKTLALLAQGANIEATDNNGNTPLLLAGGMHGTKIVLALLAQGANIEATNNNGNTPLLLAAARGGDTDTVLCLLAQGANIEATNKYGETALMRAAGSEYYNSTAIFQALLDNNANINAKNKKGQTVLDIAAQNDSFDMIEILQKHGVDISSALDIILKRNVETKTKIETYALEAQAKVQAEMQKAALEIETLINEYNGSALKSLAGSSLPLSFKEAQNKKTESPTGTPAVTTVTTVAADLIPPAP
ncbi:MAG: ankyrin repeat domain-containing protein [Pseudomonadota bacterium]